MTSSESGTSTSTSTGTGSDTGALTKQVVVPCPPAQAFELFTARMGDWWPLDAFSVGGDRATGVTVADRVGGEVIETDADGGTAVWGTVTAFSPPDRFAMTWHPDATPERATAIDVRFEPVEAGTRVTLVHTGWAAGAEGAGHRQNYDSGWDVVLGRFVSAAG